MKKRNKIAIDLFSKKYRKRIIKPKKGKVRAVLDTDTYNEIDDQFALVQMMLSADRIKVEAIYPSPFSMND